MPKNIEEQKMNIVSKLLAVVKKHGGKFTTRRLGEEELADDV